MENNVKNNQHSHSQSPSMRIFVSAFVKPGGNESYIPLQRDLEIMFYYSPASYWKNVKVTFPITHAEFILKRKDPEFYGEIRLDSEVNIHKVSLDPIDEPVRSDALRKRAERKSATPTDEKSSPTKRRLSSKSLEEKQITIAVALDDEIYSSIFNFRTMRDLNKYRYERKCIELVKKDRQLMQGQLQRPSTNQQFSQPFSIILPQSDKMDEETLSSEEEE